jgi:hypothetical protein
LEIWKWDKLTAFEAETHASHQFSFEESNLDKIRKKTVLSTKKKKQRKPISILQSVSLTLTD